MYQYKFYVQTGDDSTLKDNKFNISGDITPEKDKVEWINIKEVVTKEVEKDGMILDLYLPKLEKVEKIYDALEVVGVSSLRLANNLVALFDKNIKMTEEKTQILFS